MEKKQKVLIVEDEKDMREALVGKFELSGFEVEQAENGVGGLKQSLDSHPDIILLDIIMPEMDGIEMLKKLRENEWGKKVPVIILTNISDIEKYKEAQEIGISAYLMKAEWSLKGVVSATQKALKNPESRLK